MKRFLPLLASLCALAAPLCQLRAAIIGPYTADSNTIALYHFDESSGTIVNFGSGGSSLDMTDTGGASGRGGGGGGYGETAYSGFGSSFNVWDSGIGGYNGSTNSSGGGLRTAGAMAQSSLQGSNGEFTYEALIRVDGIAVEQNIISHDGSSTRGFLFRILTGGSLALYNGSSDVSAPIPLTGEHAFVAGDWFHVAVTYSGQDATAGNIKFYWTALSSSATQANQIGGNGLTLAADLLGTGSNNLGIGTTTRMPFRLQPEIVDEVRISNIARTADQFIFIPEPGATALLIFGGLGLLARRRQRI